MLPPPRPGLCHSAGLCPLKGFLGACCPSLLSLACILLGLLDGHGHRPVNGFTAAQAGTEGACFEQRILKRSPFCLKDTREASRGKGLCEKSAQLRRIRVEGREGADSGSYSSWVHLRNLLLYWSGDKSTDRPAPRKGSQWRGSAGPEGQSPHFWAV